LITGGGEPGPRVMVRVNGREHDVSPGITLAELLRRLGFPAEGVAVALDGEIVPRARHGDTPVRPGAVVEVIQAVGGG
jgi:sulfur carrier protein